VTARPLNKQHHCRFSLRVIDGMASAIGTSFAQVFRSCAVDGIAIRSTGEWRRFVSTLQHQGLVSKNELLILDKMWADIMEVAVATGVGRDGKGGAVLGLSLVRIV